MVDEKRNKSLIEEKRRQITCNEKEIMRLERENKELAEFIDELEALSILNRKRYQRYVS